MRNVSSRKKMVVSLLHHPRGNVWGTCVLKVRDRVMACLVKMVCLPSQLLRWNACLPQLATERYGVAVRHEVEVSDVEWVEARGGETEVVLTCAPCGDACAADAEEADVVDGAAAFELRAPFVVAADGARRTVADALEADDAARPWWDAAAPWTRPRFAVTKYEDTSVRVYKTVPFKLPDEVRGER